MTPLTSIGETVRLSATANVSDGSRWDVDNAQVQWQSSDPWVASVSEGIVTAAGGGNAVITADYEGRRVEAPVSVRISTWSTGTVRVIYAAPSDREFRTDASEAITHAIVDLQSWYRRELGGLTFSLYEATPEECRMSQPADSYGTGHAWYKVVAAVQHCAPVQHDSSDFVWVIYPDVEESCEEPHELGAGGSGLTILHRGDLEGVTNPGPYFYCDEGPYDGTLGRWIGGLGHELGHALRLPHPPGCDPWDPATCDDMEALSLMHVGYGSYPDTYLLPDDKEILIRSHFVNPDLEPLTGPPATLGLDPFYEKYLDAGGLPIVASSRVPDEALFRARAIVQEMLANRPNILAELARLGKVLAIAARTEVLTDIPGYHDLYERFPDADFDWNERHQGGGISGGTIGEPTVVWAQNIGCYEDDVFPNEDILVHEFAHTIMVVERQRGGKEFRSRLETAYENALAAGLWDNTYAGENPDEYWAEGVQSWFGLNDPPGAVHNEVNTRAELEAYDPVLANLIREVFGDVTVSASCHETIDLKKQLRIRGVVTGPSGEPLEGVGIWAWQGEAVQNGYDDTGADGTFDIRVPDGSFNLDVYAISGECSFVGWYDGSGSITTSRSQAVKIVVNGANIEGIEIRLPERPDQLTPIEWCS